MREIKFRAWHKTEQKMYPVWGIFMETVGSDRLPFLDINELEPLQLTDEIELMQFTGILDKNGREIYEGDIVRWDGYPHGVQYTRIVEWVNEEAMFLPNNMPHSVEVIGNIYEHPELAIER